MVDRTFFLKAGILKVNNYYIFYTWAEHTWPKVITINTDYFDVGKCVNTSKHIM